MDGQHLTFGRIVVLSPHPDDAVWSLGGIFPSLREHVLLVTVFDGNPPEEFFEAPNKGSKSWRAAGIVSLRRKEDRLAARSLGIELVGLDLADAAFRLDEDGLLLVSSPEDLFRFPKLKERALVNVISRKLSAILGRNDILVVPMGLGGHLDHHLTRLAAEDLESRTGVPLYYYAEFPYVQTSPAVHWKHTAISIHIASDFKVWNRAGLLYRSQVIRLFGREATFTERLKDYSGSRSSVRIWLTR